jgi:small nuclear ribonucleoprotein (snRNP)-like protein
MENDLSKQLYDSYFKLTNRTITVTLKNGRKMVGVFIAFCRGNNLVEKPYITHWHLVDKNHKTTVGIDAFGYPIGEYIPQKDIAEIQFHQNNSSMLFAENHNKSNTS